MHFKSVSYLNNGLTIQMQQMWILLFSPPILHTRSTALGTQNDGKTDGPVQQKYQSVTENKNREKKKTERMFQK